jgi:glycosyltransferase involved in cell wall biosynthesis
LIVHFHGVDAYSKDILQRLGEKYKEMFDYAAAIIVVSKDMEKKLIELGAPAQKIFVNVYGVNTDDFNQTFPGSAPPLLLGVGRFVEKKAPYLTILAFQKVLEKIPEAKLILAGTGELYDLCQKIIESLNLSHAIDLRGEVKHKEVAFLFQRARAFVQHSLVPACGDSEGTPVAILEAGACGLPVVSTFHAGIPDVVINGETGFLVNEGDIDGMADFMLQLLSNPALADKMGAKARKHIIENYTMEKSIGKLKFILENAIKNESLRN